MVIMRRGSCPPEDQPWLLSTVDELSSDAQALERATQAALGTFPGPDASLQAKIEWREKVINDSGSRFEYIYRREPNPYVGPALGALDLSHIQH